MQTENKKINKQTRKYNNHQSSNLPLLNPHPSVHLAVQTIDLVLSLVLAVQRGAVILSLCSSLELLRIRELRV